MATACLNEELELDSDTEQRLLASVYFSDYTDLPILQTDGLMEHDVLIDLSAATPPPEVKVKAESSSSADDEQPSTARYFSTVQSLRCYACNSTDHLAKDCSVQKRGAVCYMCGSGDHTRSTCTQEVCYACHRLGHISKECPEPKRPRSFYGPTERCKDCGAYAHPTDNCPLLWRCYRWDREVTAQDSASFQEYFRKLRKFCYFCGYKGHFGDDCANRARKNQFSAFRAPTQSYLRLTVHRDLSSTGRGRGRVCAEAPSEQKQCTVDPLADKASVKTKPQLFTKSDTHKAKSVKPNFSHSN